MEIDDLFPVAETLQLLRFAELAEGDIRLTDAGRRFVDAELDDAQAAVRPASRWPTCRWPATSAACSTSAPAHRAPASRFRDELEDHMSEEYAEQTLRAVISWGRYAEVFAYDEDERRVQPRQSELRA